MRLSRLALAVAATAMVAAPASSFANASMPAGAFKRAAAVAAARPHVRAPRSAARPGVRPVRPALARTADATITLGGPNYLVADPQPCSSWQRVGNLWLYSCATAYFFGPEWQYTDYVHYYWTGTQPAYYGTYRCARDKPCGLV